MTDSTVRLTTAQALVRFLQVQFSERDGQTQRAIPAIFGIFGHGNVLGVGQAVQQEGAELPLFQPKNEQSMVHTALGYAKASRRLATFACSASIGPGSTNLLTGAATATTNRLPVLLLPSDTFAGRRQGVVLQQLEGGTSADESVNDAFRPLSRFFDRVSRPEQLLTALPQAMRVLLDPAETGAVTISLHQDVQGEAFDFPRAFFEPRTWSVTRRPPAEAELAAAVQLIEGARRPLIIAGGGVRYSAAEEALHRFAERHQIPVAETSAGKGALADSEVLLGGVGVNGTPAAARIANESDLVLCIGTRLSDFTTGSQSLFQDPEVRFVGLNANATDAYKLSATPLVADARAGIEALDEALGGWRAGPEQSTEARAATASWREELGAHLAEDPSKDGAMLQAQVLKVINDETRAGDWVVAAAGWQPGDLLKMWETPPGSFTHIEFAFSCMGHEIPAGLGIRLREGADGEVFVVIGDGTYLMQPTELATAVQEGLKLTVVVLDNGGYQSINALAVGNTGTGAGNEFRRRSDDGRLPTGEPFAVDFVGNAASMGCRAAAAGSADELAAALREARGGGETTVIVCNTRGDGALPPSGVFWDLGVPEIATSAETAKLSEEHRARRAAQRSYLHPPHDPKGGQHR
ncbi:MAG: 3D-(3,5/4)-trihydroxycyclohexane-1,2-dione acylhydrolase (decyclizing) [Actinobacteria bacterium]|nr:3D-(3,5/4)-trihydroxycyclohexane-1,2-dione acylhydrolase (decyclizing) [Actinomycetota bacterium]